MSCVDEKALNFNCFVGEKSSGEELLKAALLVTVILKMINSSLITRYLSSVIKEATLRKRMCNIELEEGTIAQCIIVPSKTHLKNVLEI